MPPNLPAYLLLALLAGTAAARRHPPPSNATSAGEPVYVWPLPKSVASGSQTLTVDPDLALDPQGPGGASPAVAEAFQRYRGLVFAPWAHAARPGDGAYDVARLTVVVASDNETVLAWRCLLLLASLWFRLDQCTDCENSARSSFI
jgi:hexosaminidase